MSKRRDEADYYAERCRRCGCTRWDHEELYVNACGQFEPIEAPTPADQPTKARE